MIKVDVKHYGYGVATMAVVSGLSKSDLAIAKKAEKDYRKHGAKFEQVVFSKVKKHITLAEYNQLLEANFWVEHNKLHIDTGW